MVRLADGREVDLTLAVPGDHMLLNAVAALAAGVELGVDPQALADGLAAYTGVRRRFELKGVAAGITVYDDYAHHPTEVGAQIAAARGVLDAVAVPAAAGWWWSSSRTCTRGPATSPTPSARRWRGADLVVVLDVYGAREDPQPGVSGELIAAAVPAGAATVLYHPDRASAAAFVAGVLRPRRHRDHHGRRRCHRDRAGIVDPAGGG